MRSCYNKSIFTAELISGFMSSTILNQNSSYSITSLQFTYATVWKWLLFKFGLNKIPHGCPTPSTVYRHHSWNPVVRPGVGVASNSSRLWLDDLCVQLVSCSWITQMKKSYRCFRLKLQYSLVKKTTTHLSCFEDRLQLTACWSHVHKA